MSPTTTTTARRVRREEPGTSLQNLIEAQGVALAAPASAIDEQQTALAAIREQLHELRSMAGRGQCEVLQRIDHLEDLRRRGARYLVIPATALWWLDHYEGFGRHLEEHYRLLVHRADTCAIFALDAQEGAH